MEVSTVTSKYQATIPLSIRKILKIDKGDKLVFNYNRETESVTISKAKNVDKNFILAQEKLLSAEWLSEKDDEFFKNW